MTVCSDSHACIFSHFFSSALFTVETTIADDDCSPKVIIPNLFITRILNETDHKDNRLYHAYQLVYCGDMHPVLAKGVLVVEVLDEHHLAVRVPSS